MSRKALRGEDREFLTVREALNRGLNFFGVATLTLLAASTIHGFQIARTWSARAGDLGFLAVTIGVLLWYWHGRNRYRRSLVPLIGLFRGLLAKLTGIWLAYGRLVLAGADFGVAFYLLIAALIYAWQYFRLRDYGG
jgi:hypothetical protein